MTSLMTSLGIAALGSLAIAAAAVAMPYGCGRPLGPYGGSLAFERAHPDSGGEHGGFWGGWRGLADGCYNQDLQVRDFNWTNQYSYDHGRRGHPPIYYDP